MTFGEKLQKLRVQAGLSQDQLAELLDVSRQAVSKWERDEAMPEAEKIVRISRQFRVSTGDLLLEEREEPETARPPLARSLSRWFRNHGWLLGIFMVLYGLWQLLALVTANGSYIALLLERYAPPQTMGILLGAYLSRLAPAAGWVAAGVTAAVGGFRRAGHLRWYHAGVPLAAAGMVMVLMALLAWGILMGPEPELWTEIAALTGGTLIWGLALALAGVVVFRLGRRGEGGAVRRDGA